MQVIQRSGTTMRALWPLTIRGTAAAETSADGVRASDVTHVSSAVAPPSPDTASPALPPPAAPPPTTPRPAVQPSSVPPFPSSRVTFVFDPGGRTDFTTPSVIGSWNAQGSYDDKWTAPPVLLKQDRDGLWKATVELQNDASHKWEWGVLADTQWKKGEWMITSEGNRSFTLDAPVQAESFAPTTYHKMGPFARRDDLAFRFWAPAATDVNLKFLDGSATVPMRLSRKTGIWRAALPGGFAAWQGKAYVYDVTDAQGIARSVPDPYARSFQGGQRGISRVFLNAASGEETQPYSGIPNIPMARFEVQGHGDAQAVQLRFRDDNGNALNRQQLIDRLGTMDSSLVRNFHNGQFSDLWSDNVSDDGRISLVKQGDAWATLLNNIPKLDSLHYEFDVSKQEGGRTVLVGDRNGDGVLQGAERRATAFNDPYDNRINALAIGWPRASVVTSPSFNWQYDNTPRMATDPHKFIIYQLHVGSVFGSNGNVTRSTFRDLEKRLDYLKDLGINTVELLPTNETEGLRDWAYIGTSRFAQTQNFGYEDADGRWVGGTEALKHFIDAAHARGFNVFNDVVYNHFGGDNQTLWQADGEEANSWFNWKDGKQAIGADGKPAVDADGKPVYNMEVRNSPWGPIPAFNKKAVRQFVVDNAAMQIEELHFDGLRFDFVHLIQDQGVEAWNTLRQINRTIKVFNPKIFTVAEEFPYDTSLTDPIRNDGTGAGFDAEWNTEFQHRLVHDNDNPSIIQQAARGQQTNMDRFMDELVNHPFFSGWQNSVTIISDHDEVGNGERTVAAASGDRTPQVPAPWARGAARFAFGIGMASPGIPMFFQGEESLATNPFKWGIPSTWDNGWDWLTADTPEAAMRREHFAFCKDAIALRKSSAAFDADTPVSRMYTHNDNSVMAFTRTSGDESYLIVGSLNKNAQSGYNIAIPEGKWELVLNSDDVKYGGATAGSVGKIVQGGTDARIDLPPAAMLVFKRITDA